MIQNRIKKLAVLCQLAVATLLLSGAGFISAQSKGQTLQKSEEQITVSYKSAFSYPLNSDMRWEVHNPAGKSIKKGSGSIENFTFNQPGNYVVKLSDTAKHDPNDCTHQHFPDQLNITVSPYYMAFDRSTVKTSRTLTGGSAKGTIVTVYVDFDSYDKKVASYNRDLLTAGVGTTITGKLKNGEITLKPGKNTLEFVLDGIATTGNYIMIDFIDINGVVQSYGLTQKIQ